MWPNQNGEGGSGGPRSTEHRVSVDGTDQAQGVGPFRWTGKPTTEVLRWSAIEEWSLLDAACMYRGIRHRRVVLWVVGSELMAVVDVVEKADGGGEMHLINQFWHCGEAMTGTRWGNDGNYRIGAEALLAIPVASNVVVCRRGRLRVAIGCAGQQNSEGGDQSRTIGGAACNYGCCSGSSTAKRCSNSCRGAH